MEKLEEINNKKYNLWRNDIVNDNYKKLKYNPLFSIILTVHNNDIVNLEETIDSIINQKYNNYELIIIDDNSNKNIINVLKKYENNNKIRIIHRNKNSNEYITLNECLKTSNGDFISFIDAEDTIDNKTLYEIANKLNNNMNLELIYTDEDTISGNGIYSNPFFKPGWSMDLLLCKNYINHFTVYKTKIVKEIGLNEDYLGACEYDLLLRYIENISVNNIDHISTVLYHNRKSKKNYYEGYNLKTYYTDKFIEAKEKYLKRNGLKGKVEYISSINESRIIYDVINKPKVSIIIPSKDNPKLLKQCINSIKKVTKYKNYEIIVIDNGSNDENKIIISKYLNKNNITYIYEKSIFNFSKMCNKGVRASIGDYLLFLNDDIEIIQDNWIDLMLSHAQLKYIGAVGAKLLYPNSNIIQHGGVANSKAGPTHNFLGCDDTNNYYFNMNKIEYNCIAVTGACLLINKDKYYEVNGLDEKLAVAYNDVDLCFKLYEKGYLNVIRNDVILYHHESFTRGDDTKNHDKIIRLTKERQLLFIKHPLLSKNDPFINKNLDYYSNQLLLDFNNNKVEQYKLKKKKYKPCIGSVDEIKVNNKICISGWTIVLDEDNNDLKRYLLCKINNNNIYRIKLNNIERKDVSNEYNRKDILNSGFELNIDKKDLRFDLFKYQFGFEIIGKNNKYVTWINKTNDLIPFDNEINEDNKLYYNYYIYLENYKLHNNYKKHINWSIDEINKNEIGFSIKGYVFYDDNNYYKYKKYLLLKGNNGYYRFDVYEEKRFDVSIAFPKISNLIYTGFKCNFIKDFIYNDNCELIIHLENIYDKEDIVDIKTNIYIKKDSN